MKLSRCAVGILCLILLTTPSLSNTKVATDPTRIGVGARPLGMGKGFVGLADDVSTIFMNPSGLSEIPRWQLTTFSGKFINEYDYLNLGAAYPTKFGVFGLGYVGGGISFRSVVVTTEVVDGIRILPTSTEGSTYSFGNSVILLSYGRDLKNLFGRNYFDDLSVGATLKFFSVNLKGPTITGGTASGNEVDVGMHYKPNSIIHLGLVVQNALPFTAGGKIKWANGTEETLLSTGKVGLSLKLIGDDGWQRFNEHSLIYTLDRDFYPTRGNLPQLWHTGLEWSPFRLLEVRLGIDQETVGTGTANDLTVANNFTGGVGVYLGGFRFDYAYHQYSNLSANDTHYFSLSYGVKYEEERPKEYFKVDVPQDGAIAYSNKVELNGLALRREVAKIVVKNQIIALGMRRRFLQDVQLELGRNLIKVQALDKNDNVLAEKVIKVLRLLSFKDVTAGYWDKLEIEYLATLGIVNGYPDGTFKPDNTITRAELVTLLMKTKGVVGEMEAAEFPDVPQRHWAAKYVAAAVKAGLAKGYPDGTFRPNAPITRAEGVSVITRFAGLLKPSELITPYKDVSARYWAYSPITAAKEAGYLDYVQGDKFYPKADLKRSEVAYILTKTAQIKKIIAEKL